MAVDVALWNELERRYDGPIPEDEMDRARWGLECPDPLEQAAGRRLMWASQTRRQIRRIRNARQIAGAEIHQQALLRELEGLFLHFRGANRAYWQAHAKLAKKSPDA